MKEIIKQNRVFLIPYLAFFIVGCLLLFTANNMAALHIAINHFHNSFFDSFFYYATFLGDGVTATLLSIILLVVNFRQFLIVSVANIASAAVTQLLKHTLFSDVYRPKKFFEGIYDLYFVPGVENYLYNSFPSGHSTCAFSLYCTFALLAKKSSYKFLFFLLALLAGFSRVYLSQHFLQDVLAGSLIGVVAALSFYFLFQKSSRPFMELNIISLFKKA